MSHEMKGLIPRIFPRSCIPDSNQRNHLVGDGADGLGHAGHELAELDIGGGLDEELGEAVSELQERESVKICHLVCCHDDKVEKLTLAWAATVAFLETVRAERTET